MYINKDINKDISLTKKPGSNVIYLSFVQLVILTPSAFSTNRLKSSYNMFDIKSHPSKAVNQILIISIISNTDIRAYSIRGLSRETLTFPGCLHSHPVELHRRHVRLLGYHLSGLQHN